MQRDPTVIEERYLWEGPLLEVRGLEVAYGGIKAVKGIDLEVGEGELVTLIGANGAGKTTTLKALAGLIRPAAGRIHYNGRDITARPAFELVRQGLALVPEGRGVFGRLTVEENLEMGAYSRRDRPRIAADLDRVYALLPRLAERRRQHGGTLSGGEQQMLAIGRALMSRPRMLGQGERAPVLVGRLAAGDRPSPPPTRRATTRHLPRRGRAPASEERRRRARREGESRRAEHERAGEHRQRERSEQQRDERRGDERCHEHAAPATGIGHRAARTARRGPPRRRSPARGSRRPDRRARGRGRPRSSVPAPSGASKRSAAIHASSAPATTVPATSAMPARRRSGRSRSAISAAPWAASTDAASGWVSGRSGRDDGVRNPAPAAAALEREHEEERREHDAEQAERVRACLARRLDHAGVDGERETGDEPADPPEQQRAEDDEQPGRKRDRDRRRQPAASARRLRSFRRA